MLKIGEPQAEQKLRCVSPPWSSPVVANEASVLAFDLECGARHADDHGERVARLALAVRAVADGLNHRLGVGAVGHGATEAATGDRKRRATHTRERYPRRRSLYKDRLRSTRIVTRS